MNTVDANEELTILYDGVPVEVDPWNLWERAIAGPPKCGYRYLVPADIVDMRERYHVQKQTARTIAGRYEISVRHTYRIVNGEAYAMVPMPEKLRSGPS